MSVCDKYSIKTVVGPPAMLKMALCTQQTSIVLVAESQLVNKAEIMWAVDVVLSKHSFRSSANKSELFTAMFSDSQVAKQFSCGKTQDKYLLCFGVEPDFKEILCKTLSELELLVYQFDESYNQVVKKSQMDLHVRYWDSSLKNAKKNDITTQFLGKAAVADIMINFHKCMNGLEEIKCSRYLWMVQMLRCHFFLF